MMITTRNIERMVLNLENTVRRLSTNTRQITSLKKKSIPEDALRLDQFSKMFECPDRCAVKPYSLSYQLMILTSCLPLSSRILYSEHEQRAITGADDTLETRIFGVTNDIGCSDLTAAWLISSTVTFFAGSNTKSRPSR